MNPLNIFDDIEGGVSDELHDVSASFTAITDVAFAKGRWRERGGAKDAEAALAG